jgi:hypothetical protein
VKEFYRQLVVFIELLIFRHFSSFQK